MLQNILKQLAACKDAKLIYHNESFDTKQLTSRAMQIVTQFEKMHLPSNAIFAFCLPNSPELFCWHLACFHLGITIVPIIYEMDSDFIQQVLQTTQPTYFITTSEKERELVSIIPSSCKVQLNNDNYHAISSIRHYTNYIKSSTAKETSLAMILFYTDSNNQLKGIEHTYQSAYGYLQMLMEILATHQGLTYIVAQPMGHLGGIATTLITLLNNGTAILLEFFEVNSYMNALMQYQPTHINLHTPLFYEILDYPHLDKQAFARLKTCFAGGDAIPAQLPENFYRATGAKMQIGYGISETGIVIVNTDPYGAKAGSVGKKIKLAKIELRDAKNKPVKAGEVGEVWVQSPGVCKGYWQDPAFNQRFYIDGWFRTHDMAKEDDQGYFWYKGRQEIVHPVNLMTEIE